jgi:hypothetical protein
LDKVGPYDRALCCVKCVCEGGGFGGG